MFASEKNCVSVLFVQVDILWFVSNLNNTNMDNHFILKICFVEFVKVIFKSWYLGFLISNTKLPNF